MTQTPPPTAALRFVAGPAGAALLASALWLAGLAAAEVAGLARFGAAGLGLAVLAAGLLNLVLLALRRLRSPQTWLTQTLLGLALVAASLPFLSPAAQGPGIALILPWLALAARALGPPRLVLAGLAGILACLLALAANAWSVPGAPASVVFSAFMALLAVLSLGLVATAEGHRTGGVVREIAEAGLPARTLTHDAIIDVLEREKARVDRLGGDLSVCLVELDGFTALHRKLGGKRSDALMAAFGLRLIDSVRQMDVVGEVQPGDEPLGPFGGQEYLIVLPATGMGGARRFADRIRKIMADRPVSPSLGALRCTCSAGLARYQAGEPIHALLQRVEGALREAQAGMGVAVAGDPMHVAAGNRLGVGRQTV
jgi:diguanylate cyclase (GGDEF)-like protein